MASEWYYSTNGGQYGPVAGVGLKALVGAGKLLPTDLVWTEGMSEWQPASKVKGLFPALGAAPPPLPSTPPPPPPELPVGADADLRLGDIVPGDSQADDAWEARRPPLVTGFFGSLVTKKTQQFPFRHQQHVAGYLPGGRPLRRAALLKRLAKLYQDEGFDVQTFTHCLFVEKVYRSDSSGDLASVGTKTTALVRLAESNAGWRLDIKGEGYFWPKAAEQMAAAGLFLFLGLLFLPCLCFLPFAFAVDAEKAKAALIQEVKLPLEKLDLDLS